MPYGTAMYGEVTYAEAESSIINIGGTSAVVFTDTALLSVSMKGTDAIVFTDTATLSKGSVIGGGQSFITFAGTARIVVDVPVTPPPSDVVHVKRNSRVWPSPTLDSRGRPT